MLDPTRHNYWPKLMKLYEEGKITPASATMIDICHDDWCRIYKGGYCDCEPEIKIHNAWPDTRRN
jgi:hypothetical protein